MTTPYLDEAERCNRVTLINQGKNLMTDTPLGLKRVIKGEIVEIVCSDVRKSFFLVRTLELVKEAQAFGDRLDVLVRRAERDIPVVLSLLKNHGIEVHDWRVVPPSLENVFIALMSDNPTPKESEAVTGS